MNNLIKATIKGRKVTLFLAAVVCLIGIYSYRILPKQESPDVAAPIAMVITTYPGASPEDVKELVTVKIEEELAEVEGYKETKGTSQEGVSVVLVEMQSDVDVDKALQEVRNHVTDVQSELPSGCNTSTLKTDFVDTAGIIISLSGDQYTYEQLSSFGELFKDSLSTIDGISKFTIEGKVEKEVKVDIDVEKLNTLGLSIADINQVLEAQNMEIPSGNIEYEENRITVKTPGIFTSLEDIGDIIVSISQDTGVVARLSDVADIYMGMEEDVEKYKQNGKDTVLLTGYFEKSKNVVLIGKDVREAIDKVKAQLPGDLAVEEVIYQPEDVSDSVNNFMLNLVEGILLVIIVIFLGMGFRNAIVVSTAIPMSILMTFAVMGIMKIDIHQISLTALIISLGILVDNSIVISDVIQVRIDSGEEPSEAAYKGTAMSSVPIFTATLTTIAAFAPLLGLPGVVREFFVAIPLVLMISIIASYIVAMFIIPAMSVIFFKKTKNKDKTKEWNMYVPARIQNLVLRLKDILKKLPIDIMPRHKRERKAEGSTGILRAFFDSSLKTALKKKRVTIIGSILSLLIVIVFIVPQVPVQFFPYADKNIMYIEIYSELSGNIEATEKLADEVGALLSKEPEIKSYTISVGNGMPKFYITMNPATPSKDYAQMLCKFDLGDKKNSRFKDSVELLSYIQTVLDENISDGRCAAKLLAVAKPEEAKTIVRVTGEDSERLREVADILKEEIGKIPGTVNARHDMHDKTLEFEVNVDKDKASFFGISQYDLQQQINIALYGSNATVYRRNGEEYNIHLEGNIKSVEMLENLGIKSSVTGTKVLLKQFATVELGRKTDEINTYKQKQCVMVMANELSGYSAVNIENYIEDEILPGINTEGVSISFAGEREDISQYFSTAMILALFCLFIIYILLLIQFNSFIQPLIILMTVPLSLIGSFLGLFMLGNPLSLTAVLGIIALIGLVVKNGILLIDYINATRKRGYSIDEACIYAVDNRFNAVILSAGTTIIGLVPLALSGSSLFGPMSIALMFGLLVSTMLTMVVIPTLYSAVETYLENRRKTKI